MPGPEGLSAIWAGSQGNLMTEVISTTGQKSRLIYNLLKKKGILKPHVLLSPRHWEGNAHLDLFWNAVSKRINTDVSVVTPPAMLGRTKSSWTWEPQIFYRKVK